MDTPLRSVFVTYDFVGHHCWPEAPEHVAYLKDMHRHLFKVRAEVTVEGDNRDIEYHTLKRQLQSALYLRYTFLDDTSEAMLGPKSCEMMAEDILEDLMELVPNPHPNQVHAAMYRLRYRVEVSEDGENGSAVETWA